MFTFIKLYIWHHTSKNIKVNETYCIQTGNIVNFWHFHSLGIFGTGWCEPPYGSMPQVVRVTSNVPKIPKPFNFVWRQRILRQPVSWASKSKIQSLLNIRKKCRTTGGFFQFIVIELYLFDYSRPFLGNLVGKKVKHRKVLSSLYLGF